MKKRIIAAALICALCLSLGGCALSPVTILQNAAGGGDGPKAEAAPDSKGLSAKHKYTITFDPNGGSLDGEDTVYVKDGETPTAPEASRNGWQFAGWEPALAPADGDAAYVAQWSLMDYTPEDLYAAISPAVAEITVYVYDEPFSLGSGFFIDDRGTLVTNYHVIEGGDAAVATTEDGREHSVTRLLAFDSALDLALLQVDVEDNAYLELSTSGVRTGEDIYALGSSLGLTSTFSSGIVSTASREQDGISYIQITAPISHGNSGGPLVDEHGQVVGVNTMTLTEGQNLNFAIDIKELDRLDRSNPMTMTEYYDEVGFSYHEYGTDHEQTGWFYDECEYTEMEGNDSILLADSLYNGEWTAGDLSDIEDIDWFYLELEEPGTIAFEVVPFYTSDNAYLLCGVVEIGEEDFEIVDILYATDERAYDIENYVELTFDKAGLYFVLIGMTDDYDYDEPLPYMVRAAW